MCPFSSLHPGKSSCRSQSPLRAPSRGRSASDGAKCCSQSPSQCADEDLQVEQSLLDFVSVVAVLRSLNELSKAPSESCKICSFGAALEDDDRPTYSHCLPVGGASADILEDIDDRISSPSLGMCSKRASRLLQYPVFCSHGFYHFEGDETTKTRSLNHHVKKLAGLFWYDIINKTDIILFSSEAEDMEAALRPIVEATSWMDWWTLCHGVPGSPVIHGYLSHPQS